MTFVKDFEITKDYKMKENSELLCILLATHPRWHFFYYDIYIYIKTQHYGTVRINLITFDYKFYPKFMFPILKKFHFM